MHHGESNEGLLQDEPREHRDHGESGTTAWIGVLRMARGDGCLKTNHGEHRDHREKQEGLWGRLLFLIPRVPCAPRGSETRKRILIIDSGIDGC